MKINNNEGQISEETAYSISDKIIELSKGYNMENRRIDDVFVEMLGGGKTKVVIG